MGEETEFRNILIAEMAVELPCTHPNCTYGVDGTPYKTPALDGALALQILELHDKQSHQVRGAGVGVSKSTWRKFRDLSSVGEVIKRTSD